MLRVERGELIPLCHLKVCKVKARRNGTAYQSIAITYCTPRRKPVSMHDHSLRCLSGGEVLAQLYDAECACCIQHIYLYSVTIIVMPHLIGFDAVPGGEGLTG